MQTKDPLSPETILKTKKSKSPKKNTSRQSSSKSTSSGEKRKDSVSATPTDGIPVITISKTESNESILQDSKDQHFVKNSTESTVASSHKPKVKYLLKKQNANVDIDSISFI